MKTERLLERLARVRRQEATPATMNLITRQGSAQDLARCKVLHCSLRLPYPEGCSRALVEMWRALLSNWAMQISLVEDRAKPLSHFTMFWIGAKQQPFLLPTNSAAKRDQRSLHISASRWRGVFSPISCLS